MVGLVPLCNSSQPIRLAAFRRSRPPIYKRQGVFALRTPGFGYTPEQGERLKSIHNRLIEARRELDALIGDAYLRSRASIVPVHFLDLASAVEKLRWAEKEWRELDKELAEASSSRGDGLEESPDGDESESEDEEEPLQVAHSH